MTDVRDRFGYALEEGDSPSALFSIFLAVVSTAISWPVIRECYSFIDGEAGDWLGLFE